MIVKKLRFGKKLQVKFVAIYIIAFGFRFLILVMVSHRNFNCSDFGFQPTF